MRVSFWGVRGSTLAPLPHAFRHGGNTPCVEVRAADQLLILDAGTGLRDLGLRLQAEGVIPALEAHLLLTHYHWAHLQGLPFFAPLFAASTRIKVFGPRLPAATAGGLRGIFQTLLSAPFFGADNLWPQATLSYQELDWASELALGPLRLRTCRTHHPQGALAFRLEHDGFAVVYAPDHQPGQAELDLALRQLARGAHLLICDAEHGAEELGARSLGHGSWESASALAREAGVKNLVLFHHHPGRADHQLDDFVRRARRLFPRTWAAQEGMHVDLAPSGVQLWARRGRRSRRACLPLPVRVEAAEAAGTLRRDARLENLSLQGAYILSPHQYDLQQALDLLLDLPGESQEEDKGNGKPPVVRLRGSVMRVEPLTTNSGWVGIGVNFAEPETTDALGVPGEPDVSPNP